MNSCAKAQMMLPISNVLSSTLTHALHQLIPTPMCVGKKNMPAFLGVRAYEKSLVNRQLP